MLLILAFVQFAFCAAFAALGRWVEAGALAALGLFFAASFLAVPAPQDAPLAHDPHDAHDPLTAGDLQAIAKTGSYWLSSGLFYLSLFGMAYGASSYVPGLDVRSALGGTLSAVSVALLALYAATWKKGVPQVALVLRINAVLISAVSAATMLYAAVRPFGYVPWVFWSHAGLSAAALAVSLSTDRFAEPKFLRFLLAWAAGFGWALCTYLVSLLWSGVEPVVLTAALFGLGCFWLPSVARLPAGWPMVARMSGAVFTLAAGSSAAVAAWFADPWPWLAPCGILLAAFHVWIHREYRNWVAYGAALAAAASLYVRAFSGAWDQNGFWLMALVAVGLPALAVGLSRSARLRAGDAWAAQYAAGAVMAGYAWAGYGRFGYGPFEWSALLMAASLVWYAAWTSGARD